MNNENRFSGGYDARYQQFSIEMLNKESKCRREWFKKHFNKIYASYLEHEIPKDAELLLAKLKQRGKKPPDPFFGYKVQKDKTEFPPPNADINLMTMRPIEDEVRELLYQGISHHGEGRYNYLKTRLKKSPKERYWFPESSQWDYGWLGDSNDDCLKDQKFGLKSGMEQTCFSRNGVLELEEDIQPLSSVFTREFK